MSLAVSSLVNASAPAPAAAATPLPRVRADVIYQAVPEGAVLLATRDEIYYGLNEVGARIWALLTGGAPSLEALCGTLHQEYPDAPLHVLRADVLELLSDLAAAGLVEGLRQAA